MDGVAAPVVADGAPPVLDPVEASMTRGEAMRTGAFWMVTLALCVQSMVFTGVTFHIVDIGLAGGMTREAAVALFVPIAFIGVPMGFAVGGAADRVSLRLLVIVMTFCQIFGFIGVAYIGEPGFRIAAIVGWGLSQGFFGPLTTVAIPKLFGRRHLGSIAGIQMSCLVIGSALGPAALAASRQIMGSYRFGMLACCLLAVIPFVLAVTARERRPEIVSG
jgi:cyanate permease